VEEWHIYNFSGDAHPMHVHLVNFEVIGRNWIDENHIVVEERDQLQHSGNFGKGFKISFPEGSYVESTVGEEVDPESLRPYAESGFRKDIVTALPGQITKIVAKFDKPGRYVWHCVRAVRLVGMFSFSARSL